MLRVEIFNLEQKNENFMLAYKSLVTGKSFVIGKMFRLGLGILRSRGIRILAIRRRRRRELKTG